MTLAPLYAAMREAAATDLKSPATRTAIQRLVAASLASIRDSESEDMNSRVTGKHYVTASRGSRRSRPINTGLFLPAIKDGDLFAGIFGRGEPGNLSALLYTAAMSFPVANDLECDIDQVSARIFFEIIVGHIAASIFGVNPVRQIAVSGLGQITLPADVFQLSKNSHIHVPTKISTREHAIQIWAQQKLLDGVYGAGSLKGFLVCLSEAYKRGANSVVEVCSPKHFAAYQMYIARLDAVYYLDPPERYAGLRESHPHLEVWPFARFLTGYAPTNHACHFA